jgi:hypothetical protein
MVNRIVRTAAMLSLWTAATAAGGAGFGPAEITLSGQPAPGPTAAACGFSLIVGNTGPQIAFMQPAGMAVASLMPGEDVAISVPFQNFSGLCMVRTTAWLLEGRDAEVSISLGNAVSRKVLQRHGPVFLETVGKTGDVRAEIRMTVRARSSAAVVRWSQIEFLASGQTIPVTLNPGDQAKTQRASGQRLPSAAKSPLAPSGSDVAPVLPAFRPGIELAFIEWDWRMQDGIGTPREPTTYKAAIEQSLRRGDRLLSDLQSANSSMDNETAQWLKLKTRFREMAANDANYSEWEDLWRQVHVLRRRIALTNPSFCAGPIVFCKQVPSIFSHQLTQYYGSCARPGGGVFVLEEPGRSMRCRPLVSFASQNKQGSPSALPLGSCQHPEVSWDGRRVLFSYCHAETTPRDREEHLDRYYHLVEIGANGSDLRQLTDGPYDDFSPRYLPDGKILFISTRRGGYHRCGRGPCPVYTLAVCNADGSSPHPISYHETHEWDPAVLQDGRIIYTRWDYVDRHAVHYQQLWSVRPDGSDVRIFYGNNTFNPVGVWEARPVPGSRQIIATAAAHHAMTAGSIILLDVTRGIDDLAPITRLTPDVLFSESETPVAPGWRAAEGVVHQPATPREAARWPGHCYRSPYPLSEKYFLAAYSFDSLLGEPLPNPANMFGLYLVDSFGNKELLYRDVNIASVWPVVLGVRPLPPVVPSLVEPSGKAEGTFLVRDAHAAWPPLPPGTIKRLRIVQVLPKSTPHANSPMVGAANASPGRQVLGTVPVEEDGSAYFRAPSGIPLSFQALDDRGQAVQIMRSVTYLQPGETSACIGCHESRSSAPPVRRRPMAVSRPPSPITPGPIGSKPLSYPILVQSLLDRKCVSCHNAAKPEGKVILTGEPQGQFTASYNALLPLVPYSAWRDGDYRRDNSEPLSMPDRFGARGSRLMKLLQVGHYQVELTPEERESLITWMDTNVLFYGTFNPKDQARQLRGETIAGPDVE